MVVGRRLFLGREFHCGTLWYLSLMLFNIYMHPVTQLVRGIGLGCHEYVDDTQLYMLIDSQLDATQMFWLGLWMMWLAD